MGPAPSPPPSKPGAGVGCLSAQLYASCFQHRVRLNEGNDIYHFSERLGVRLWQQKDLPAVASLDKHMEEAREAQRELQIRQAQAAREQGNNKNDDTNEEGESTSSQLMPVVYESLHFVQKSGAGSQAYSRVKEEYTKWRNFLSQREGSIDRFDVTDYRSQEEQDQESAISGRLKAYTRP